MDYKNIEDLAPIWEIVGDEVAPILFQVKGTTIDATNASIEVRGWSTAQLKDFASFMSNGSTISNEDIEDWVLSRQQSSVEIPSPVNDNDGQP